MSDSSRTLEQRKDAIWDILADHPDATEIAEAAGLPDLLAERDALLERVETAEAAHQTVTASLLNMSVGLTRAESERDAAQAAAEEWQMRAESAESELDRIICGEGS